MSSAPPVERSPAPERPPGPGAALADAARARAIWVDLLLYPTHTLPTAAAPVLVGLGLAFHDRIFAPVPVLVGFLGSWVIHLAGVFADNHELLRKHPALPEHPELNRALADGALRLSALRAAILACLALALATVPYLHGIGGAPVLAFGAIGVVASLSYNAGPAYVRRGIADPVFFLMFGVVAVAGTWFIQAAAVQGAPAPWRLVGGFPLPVLCVGLPTGAIVTSVMLVDDMRDHEFDRAKGWRTLAVTRGPGFVRREIELLLAFAYAMPFAFWVGLGFEAYVLLPLASLPLACRIVRVLRTYERREQLAPISPAMARLALVHSALLGVGLALSR